MDGGLACVWVAGAVGGVWIMLDGAAAGAERVVDLCVCEYYSQGVCACVRARVRAYINDKGVCMYVCVRVCVCVCV